MNLQTIRLGCISVALIIRVPISSAEMRRCVYCNSYEFQLSFCWERWGRARECESSAGPLEGPPTTAWLSMCFPNASIKMTDDHFAGECDLADVECPAVVRTGMSWQVRHSITNVGFEEMCRGERGDQYYLPLTRNGHLLGQIMIHNEGDWPTIVNQPFERVLRNTWLLVGSSIVGISLSFAMFWIMIWCLRDSRRRRASDIESRARRLSALQEAIEERCPAQVFGVPTEVTDSDCQAVTTPQCAICLAGIETGDALRMLPCVAKHTYHADCIDGWLLRDSGETSPQSSSTVVSQLSCPLCRQAFTLPIKQDV